MTEKDNSLEAGIKKCKICGCTDDDCTQCVKAQGKVCTWVTNELCSRCDKTINTEGPTILSAITSNDREKILPDLELENTPKLDLEEITELILVSSHQLETRMNLIKFQILALRTIVMELSKKYN